MSKIPVIYLEIAPFAFSIFLTVTSFLQSNLTEVKLTETIVRHWPDLAQGDSGTMTATIARFAVDISVRINFFVAVITSIVAGLLIGINKGNAYFVLGSVVVLICALYVTVFQLWKWDLGYLLEKATVLGFDVKRVIIYDSVLIVVNGIFVVSILVL